MGVPLLRNHKLAHSRAALLLTLALTTLGGPQPALAQSCIAPPGNSGIDEYCESIPGPGGDRGSGDRPSGPGIPRATSEVLERNGQLGRSVTRLAPQTEPSGKEPSKNEPPAARGGEPQGDPLSAVTASVESGASSGSVFVWILVGLGLLAAAAGWLRFRGRAS